MNHGIREKQLLFVSCSNLPFLTLTIMISLSKLSHVLLASMVLAGMMLSGCVRDKCDMNISYMEYTPVYMNPIDFKNAVAIEAPRDLKNPGKIYVKDDYLFVNEVAKGVHVFDNTDPANPIALAFINAPGTYDMAVNCDKLYIDSSTDLLVFDISDPAAPQLQERVENALPHIIFYQGYQADPNQGIVVEWTPELKTVPYACDGDMSEVIMMNQFSIQPNVDPAPTLDQTNFAGRSAVNVSTPGQAGSMSRFAVKDERLYVVTTEELRVYDVTNCGAPGFIQSVEIQSWGGEAETIFPLDNLLLIGSTSGMFIYDTQDPNNPQMLSVFQHVTSCDPVVSDGQYAYVTLRSEERNNRCDGWTNQLDVLDISNPANPFLIRTYQMTRPAGLGIDGESLFVCDGDAGLKVFDATNPQQLSQTQNFTELNAMDVIPNDGNLIMVGADGIVQYSYDGASNMQKLSTIPVR